MIRRIAVILLAVLIFLPISAAFAKGEHVVKIGEDIEISKNMLVSDAIAIGGNITVYGKVEDNVVAVGGSVILKGGSYVGRQVVVVGGDLQRDPSAEIGGETTRIYMPNFIPSLTTFLKGGWLAFWVTISFLALVGFLGLAVLMTALLPEHIRTAVDAMQKSFAAMFLWGVLWMLLIVPIAVLLAVSIIGIILIPLEILLVAIALILGYISAAIFIGKKILMSFKKIPPPFVDVILGILILFLVGFLPIIGPIAKALFLIAGFGAVLTTRFGTIR